MGFSVIIYTYLKFYSGSESGIFSININSPLLTWKTSKKINEKEDQKRGPAKLIILLTREKAGVHGPHVATFLLSPLTNLSAPKG